MVDTTLPPNSNIPAGQTGSPWVLNTPPNTATAVPSSQINSGALNIPPVVPSQSSPTAFVNSLGFATPVMQGSDTPSLDKALGLYNNLQTQTTDPNQQQYQQNIDQSTQQFQDLSKQVGNRAGDTQAAYDTYGVNKAMGVAAQLNTELAQKTAEYNNAFQDAEVKGLQTGTPGVIYQGVQAAIQRQKAVVLGGLATQLQAAQGNYTMAKSLADQTVNLKYQDIQDKIDNTLKFIDLNRNNLSASEKKQADKMAFVMQERQRQLDAQKEKEKEISNIMIEAAKVGADGETLKRIQSSDSIGQAIQNSGEYLSAEFRQKLQQQQFDNNIKLQNLALDRAQVGIAQARLAMDKAGAGNFDPAEITAYAQQYAATGKIPTGMPKGTFGIVTEVAKSLPKAAGTLVEKNTGVKSDSLPAAVQDDLVKLFNIIKLTDTLKKLDKDRVGGLTGGIANKIRGSDSQYIITRKAITDEIQRMQSGAALTEKEQQFYGDYLPGRYSEKFKVGSFGFGQDSQKQIDNFKGIMETKLNNALNNNNLSIYGYSSVKLEDGKEYKVGDIVTNGDQQAVVGPDGQLRPIN